MRKLVCFLLATLMAAMLVSCSSASPEQKGPAMEPQISQMKAICELSVMECYYHNVAKFTEKDAQGLLWWKKDKHFWIEYSGIVKLGVDMSLVTIKVDDTQISITLPAAKLLGCKVDSASITEDSFIVDDGSAKIEAADEVNAFRSAQDKLEAAAAGDTALLSNAQQRTQVLLEDYITNIGNAVGKEYSINWIYTDANGNPLGTSANPSGAKPMPTTEFPQ